ncbi:MAG: S8 family serine peptidase [Deltaproteobacteria bacterium]|nr:S8 family serine peptidase [Deltaproteobacteria bacterium]
MRAAPGHVVVRTRPGWEGEDIAAHRDVRHGLAAAACSIDGGSIDDAIRRRAGAMSVARAFYSRRGLDLGGGRGDRGYDDLEHELGLSRTFRIAFDPRAPIGPVVEDLAALDAVESVTPAYICASPVAPAVGAAQPRKGDRARALIGAARAAALEPGDLSLIVGLVDSGVDFDHPELVGRLRPGVSSVALKPGWSEGDLRVISGARPSLQDIADDEGHGTGCAALLAAIGVAIEPGVAGIARLLPIRALCGAIVTGRRAATAIGLLPDIDSGLKTCVDLGARVINMSFGTPESDLDGTAPHIPHVEVVRYALAHDCILVAASGNTGRAERFFPAALPGVIAVGAVDDDRRPASFTTRGDHVALSAPGVRIVTAGIDGYVEHSGTSFAAPFVTGACALLVARAARWSRPLGPAAVRRILVESAQRFAGGVDTTGCGAGILDLPAALAAVDALCREDHDTDAAAA